jgi:hypothetical protein
MGPNGKILVLDFKLVAGKHTKLIVGLKME